MTSRILIVDDDTNLLDGCRRALRRHFDVTTACSGNDGLTKIAESQRFAVVLSDMRMPGMTGVQFLEHVQTESPDSVRIMLTGNADQQTAIDAINSGRIFRFLNKPCLPEKLFTALHDGVNQYGLQMAERELLDGTVRGCVRAMTEILSLTNPLGFGRAARVRKLVSCACETLRISNSWELEVAAMMSQAGVVTLPEAVLEKALSGLPLTPDENGMLGNLRNVAVDLIQHIPRLAVVTDYISACDPAPDPAVARPLTPLPGSTPLEVKLLQAALDLEMLISLGRSEKEAFAHLRSGGRVRDENILFALEESFLRGMEKRAIPLRHLQVGQVLAEDVMSIDGGRRLLGRSYEITERLLLRLQNYHSKHGVREPIQVLARDESANDAWKTTVNPEPAIALQ
ncbi:MAG: response regulator [Planctomycetota bacterium]|nr:response regulator [Planctomycetota bacterium]